MPDPYYRTPTAEDGTYDQWTLLREADGHYVRHDKVTVAAHLSGAPYVRMLGRYPLGEFLVGEHHPRAKTRLQAILDQG
jgi:hypothetical protein